MSKDAPLSSRADGFEDWFKSIYIKRGFVSSKAELQEAWNAAVSEQQRMPLVLQVLVDWERANGALAGITPPEVPALMDKLTDAACIQSPRQAATLFERSERS